MSSDRMIGMGRTSFVEKHAPWTEQQAEAAARAIEIAREKNIQTVRLSFVDQHGVLRGKTVVADTLPMALKNGCGMTTTMLLKDTSHRTVYPVWKSGGGFDMAEMTGASDFVMVPDPTTFRILPWAEHSAWMLCDAYFPSGEPVPFSTRKICADALERLSDQGYDYLAGLELEFYIYKLEDAKLRPEHCTQPPAAPEVSMLAHGFQYLTENRYDELDPIMDKLRAALLQLGLPVRTLESEFGPSQCELTFGPVTGLAAADNVVLVRSAIKQICRRNGLHATFMCRPAIANALSSGWHLHQSLLDKKTGANVFMSTREDELLSPIGRHFVGGLLKNAREGCIFATPTINGYKRYRPFSLAPKNVVWGRDNRGAMIRVIGGPNDPASHIENRIGESAANPYLYFTSQILSGLEGIENKLEPTSAVDTPYDSTTQVLPAHLVEAIAELRGSELYRRRLGDKFVDYFLTIKDFEVHRFLSDEVTDWEQREYFETF
jgi:glutamine synthetase